MSPMSLALTIFVNFSIYLVLGTVGLVMLASVFDIAVTFNAAVVVGFVLLITDIVGQSLRKSITTIFSTVGDDMEQTQDDELFDFLEDVLNTLLHTKGNTTRDEVKRRELVDQLSELLE